MRALAKYARVKPVITNTGEFTSCTTGFDGGVFYPVVLDVAQCGQTRRLCRI